MWLCRSIWFRSIHTGRTHNLLVIAYKLVKLRVECLSAVTTFLSFDGNNFSLLHHVVHFPDAPRTSGGSGTPVSIDAPLVLAFNERR